MEHSAYAQQQVVSFISGFRSCGQYSISIYLFDTHLTFVQRKNNDIFPGGNSVIHFMDGEDLEGKPRDDEKKKNDFRGRRNADDTSTTVAAFPANLPSLYGSSY
jgi:hypothetical protein